MTKEYEKLNTLIEEIDRIERTYKPIGLVTLKLKYLRKDLRELESKNE